LVSEARTACFTPDLLLGGTRASWRSRKTIGLDHFVLGGCADQPILSLDDRDATVVTQGVELPEEEAVIERLRLRPRHGSRASSRSALWRDDGRLGRRSRCARAAHGPGAPRPGLLPGRDVGRFRAALARDSGSRSPLVSMGVDLVPVPVPGLRNWGYLRSRGQPLLAESRPSYVVGRLRAASSRDARQPAAASLSRLSHATCTPCACSA
jgi:hypothetical protein